jgi:hypothetical protein
MRPPSTFNTWAVMVRPEAMSRHPAASAYAVRAVRGSVARPVSEKDLSYG